MGHKDILKSIESLEKHISEKNDEKNFNRYGTFGTLDIDYERVVDSLIADRHIDSVDYRPIGEAKKTVDETVAEVGDHFIINRPDRGCDLYLHLAYNIDTYIGRAHPQFIGTFEAFRGDPILLRAKLREKIFLKPRDFIQKALAADWTDHKTPVRIYVDKICQRLKFSYSGEPQRAGVTLMMSWMMGRLIELGDLELRDEDGERVVYLADDEAANWVLDEMLGWTDKKSRRDRKHPKDSH